MNHHFRRGALVGLSLLAVAPAEATGQEREAVAPATRTVVAGEQYAKGGFKRFFIGDDYRDLWTRPIEVEVLDMGTFAGGLTPVMRVGGQQSLGLALKGADGRAYTFRGVDKDPSGILPEDLQETVVDEFVQDQIAASHPAGAPIAAELSVAAGVPFVETHLVVLGDDQALGEFREDFAGKLGTISIYPQPVSETNPGFEGATEILDHLELYARIRASASERVDDGALIRARLLDVFIGDWDRHRKQWRWARIPGKEGWQPLPEDHDQAFCRYEGIVLGLARPRQPRFVVFGPEYPSILGLTWNGWEQDRVLLTGLEWPVWEEIARDLQRRLTDDVIERAVRRMPPEYLEMDGERMIEALRQRREALPDAARQYYELLAGEVEVHGTDQAEVAEIRRLPEGDLEVRLTALGPDGAGDGEPFYARRFHSDETDEVRVFLHGGDDRASVRGGTGGPIRIRVVAGDGRDVLDDSQGGGTRFYDASGIADLREGPGTRLDTRPYEAPIPVAHVPWLPPRDWGSQMMTVPYSGWSADYGLFLGTGIDYRRYGFRKNPYSSRHVIRGGYAFRASAARFDYRGEFRRESSGAYASLRAFASGLELLRFHGLGNETSDEEPEDYYKVEQTQYLLAPTFTFPLAGPLEASIAPVAKLAVTRNEEGRLVGEEEPYGIGSFGQLGGAVRLELDTRDGPVATSGVHLMATGAVYPSWWDVEATFSQLFGGVSGFLTARGRFETTLALRVGGHQNWGKYPFHEAAFIGGGGFFGGSQTVRGLLQNRYAGDAAVYGNAEIRTRLGRMTLVLPATVGVFGFADVGRVFLEGEDSDTWHPGYGGGLWISYLERKNTISIAMAESEGRLAAYIRLGFAF